jgi:hypothetical protein
LCVGWRPGVGIGRPVGGGCGYGCEEVGRPVGVGVGVKTSGCGEVRRSGEVVGRLAFMGVGKLCVWPLMGGQWLLEL